MSEYRWNQLELAAGYDAGAPLVHPFYVEVQDAILEQLSFTEDVSGLLVDLGGGSGRLIERVLERWPRVTAVIVDQSQAFLDLAQSRLDRFGDRTAFVCQQLQSDWREVLPTSPTAIVSMSAIHHLDPDEKQAFYQQACDALAPNGLFLNGDEVRAESDEDYRQQLDFWSRRMDQLIAEESLTPAMAEAVQGWQRRNVEEFHRPKLSGDDCHETADVQLQYLRDAGFVDVEPTWQQELWTVLKGRSPAR